MKTKKARGRKMFTLICILTFIVSFGIGVVSKIALKLINLTCMSLQTKARKAMV